MTDDHARAPVRFLEKLAPGMSASSGSVRPALAPRFAPRGETQGLAVEPERSASLADRSTQAGDEFTTQTPQPVFTATPPDQPARQGRTAIFANTPLSPRPPSPISQTAHLPFGLEPEASPTATASLHGKADVAGVTPSPVLRHAEPGTARPQHEQDAGAAMPALQTVAEPWAAGRVSPPLRESTIAQRAAAPSASQAPTVVHVTIDRIDVRAPAAAATRARPQPTPRVTPDLSLKDYLRQRERAGRGGSS
jgi:hypothetical protein